jgi:hypothetical protein
MTMRSKRLCASRGCSTPDAVADSATVPTPDGSPAHKIIWQAGTAAGPIGVIVVAGENKSHDYTEACTVTAPADSADFMQSWLRSSLGQPTSTLKKPDGASEIHWQQTSQEMRFDVSLLTQMPDKKSAAVSVMK